MHRKPLLSVAIALGIAAVSGCASQQPPMTPEQQEMARQMQQALIAAGYILIEKIPEEKGSLQELTGIFSSLGETVGLSEADGYMLLHAETGRTVKLDISIDDKDVYEYSNCKRQNDFVNKCADMSSYESIYRKDGSRNQGHYFWRVDWMQTPQGPFAVVQEAGTRKINVVNLESGVKATVLERTLGISSYNLYQAPDGTISINAQMGFSKQTIDDAILAYEQQLTQLSQN
ncbi:hypothetical protein [uncultured Marinobacter sp.]|uniref:hypothetical protein n=1 Tax=uncultured Marinobacter sp. TaxID=187379 RepID=UPI002585C67F|nr:hypothetical protein [uncultured Marinobacter sp.]